MFSDTPKPKICCCKSFEWPVKIENVESSGVYALHGANILMIKFLFVLTLRKEGSLELFWQTFSYTSISVFFISRYDEVLFKSFCIVDYIVSPSSKGSGLKKWYDVMMLIDFLYKNLTVIAQIHL